jgi:CRISPR system Cascade subunit CasE
MYLTRMYLNTRRRSATALLTSPQRMHAAVESAFAPAAFDRSAARTLWRIDKKQDSTALILASPVEPDLSHLVEQAGWRTGELWQTRPYAPLLDRLDDGQLWRFRLVANPTYAGRQGGWDDTKPCGHVTVKKQQEWLLDRSLKHGFSVPNGPSGTTELIIAERRTERFSRGSSRVTITVAAYEGLLRVTDPILLRAALTHGIGRAKAYGCGLITLAAAQSA